MRIRTVSEAYAYYKQKDKDTALTERGFLSMVKDGLFPAVLVGKTIYIDLNDIDKSFNDDFCITNPLPPQFNTSKRVRGIRPVNG